MSGRKTEAELLQQAVAGMTAPQALLYLAQLVREGGPQARGEAIAELIRSVAGTLAADQMIIREGIPVDSHEEEVLALREYAVRRTGLDGDQQVTPYGDRLFTAVRDAAEVGEGEVLCRDIVVGPWRRDVAVQVDGAVQRGDTAP